MNAVTHAPAPPARTRSPALGRSPRCVAEAELTPKPGLVDRRGGGAHARHGPGHRCSPPPTALPSAFAALRAAPRTRCRSGASCALAIGAVGRAGERAMLAATGGVNTHRGALWALGLLAAGGRAPATDVDGVARSPPQLAGLPIRAAGPALSHGARARLRYGDRPARRARRAAGFPHVTRIALPALRAAREPAGEQTRPARRAAGRRWPPWTTPACCTAAGRDGPARRPGRRDRRAARRGLRDRAGGAGSPRSTRSPARRGCPRRQRRPARCGLFLDAVCSSTDWRAACRR